MKRVEYASSVHDEGIGYICHHAGAFLEHA